MKLLSIDLECYSDVNLSKSGVYRYVDSPNFQILLFGYSVDGSEVHVVDLAQGEELPIEIKEALTDENVTKISQNANFERVCLSHYLGMPIGEYLDPEQWKCSMVWGAYLGLPMSLKDVGTVLGLEKQKLEEGKDLIRLFCIPDKNGNRRLPQDYPEKWELFKRYNKRDVETEMEILSRLKRFPVPDFVWDEYHQDQEINDRGIRIDRELVEQAIRMDELTKAELNEKLQKLTMLDNPNSVMQMKQWLAEQGLEMDSLGKKEVTEALKTCPQPLADVLMLRQQLSKSSVKKYQAMENCVCSDGRCRGMFQFYGANRTGRFAGKLCQLQNLPQNHMEDLDTARSMVKSGDYEAVRKTYGNVSDVLSQLIRTAFIPYAGGKFIVADFSAIEARVIAWLAGEKWRQNFFAQGGDIYCKSASQMFGIPVEKHGINGHLRQKGKIAELACIAEGSLVLTDHGLIPIENVTTADKLWDGENWVSHEGVVYKGEGEVITYEGLTATKDHLVWVEGQQRPVRFGIAAASGAHLLQTGDGGKALRMGENNFSGEKVEREMESLLCSDTVHQLRENPVAELGQSENWKIKRLSGMLEATPNSSVVRQETDSSKTKMRESKRCRLCQLRRQRNKVRFFRSDRSRIVPDRHIRSTGSKNGNRQDRRQWKLLSRKPEICNTSGECRQSEKHTSEPFRPTVLALCGKCCCKKTVRRIFKRRNHKASGDCSIREEKMLEDNKRKARLYDIQNAGRYHRFTVSGKLVHNCGYGGSSGALKAMGALEMGLKEEELKPLVDAWRKANPHIVKLWWDVDKAVKTAVADHTSVKLRNLNFRYEAGFLIITLPSGRELFYVKPRIELNQFGGECVTYMGIGSTKKWERIESYGPKFVENCVQGIARDILCYAMQTLRCCRIVAHVHDEVIIEADPQMSLEAVCEQMGRTPPWANGLLLRADGYECQFYKKD